MKILLDRTYKTDKQTIGRFYLLNDSNSVIDVWDSLELPDKNNQVRVSRIPAGEYLAVLHRSPKFGKTLWLQNVPNRSEILVHKGNFHTDILGCILIGQDLRDINGDGYMDVVSSANAMKEMLGHLGELKEIKIQIIDED